MDCPNSSRVDGLSIETLRGLTNAGGFLALGNSFPEEIR